MENRKYAANNINCAFLSLATLHQQSHMADPTHSCMARVAIAGQLDQPLALPDLSCCQAFDSSIGIGLYVLGHQWLSGTWSFLRLSNCRQCIMELRGPGYGRTGPRCPG